VSSAAGRAGRITDLAHFGEGAGDRRRQCALAPPAQGLEADSLVPAWQPLARLESESFAKGLWAVWARQVSLHLNLWRYPNGIDLTLLPVSSDHDLLLDPPHWAAHLLGRGLIAALDADGRACRLDSSGYAKLPPLAAPHLFLGGSPKWGHWIADILPLLAARAFFPELAERPLLLAHLDAVQAECLDLLGFDSRRRTLIDRQGADAALLPAADLAFLSAPPLTLGIDWVGRELRAAAGPPDADAPERVYLSRRTFHPVHRIANQDSVEALFASRGFAVIAPETMGVAALIRRLGQAKIVAAPIGGALGNFVLAPPDATFLHLMPDWLMGEVGRHDLLIGWMRYYYPMRERMILVYGRIGPAERAFAAQHGLGAHDIPAHYDLAAIDQALLLAEKPAAGIAARARARQREDG